LQKQRHSRLRSRAERASYGEARRSACGAKAAGLPNGRRCIAPPQRDCRVGGPRPLGLRYVQFRSALESIRRSSVGIAMLSGFNGHLLSGEFVESHVPAIVASAAAERVRRELAAWRTRCAALGPASTPRTILQSAAAPLCAALGFDPPAAIEPA